MRIDPDAAGLDGSRLERIAEHLQSRYVDPGKITGCQVLVERHGQVAYFKSLGTLDLAGTRPVLDDTIWRIYSMTKPITSVALMSLYERGLFQLTDPVARFVPAWKDLTVAEPDGAGSFTIQPCRRPMTVRDLLMHTSGLSYGRLAEHPATKLYQDARLRDWDLSAAGLVARLGELPLLFQPGSRWHYSLATDVCGHVVEVLSGRPLDEFFTTEIFEPLGMVDTGFWIPEADQHRLAPNHQRSATKRLEHAPDSPRRDYLHRPVLLSGGGGLVSTSSDYLRFCRMLLNGGELDGARILGRKTVELVRQNHLPGGSDIGAIALGQFGETQFDGVGFGLGFAVSLGPVQAGVIGSAGEYYWGGAASTIFWLDPLEDLAVIFMTQLMPSQTFNFRAQLRSIIYPAIQS